MATGVPQANGQIAPEPLLGVDHVVGGRALQGGLPLDANVRSSP